MLPYLQGGYIVTVPDKQGKEHAFASGLIEGHHTPDGVCGALKFDKPTFSDNAKVIGRGYSSGPSQIGRASQLLAGYTPELPMVVGTMVARLQVKWQTGFFGLS
ncbi:triacylglycerol lipase [Malassezia pachydermatis]|uniref:triacylglycerol lipase n=1 Tax=Malassezia pachydermatis TaxID=77020 RepID=A0A0M8MNT0_9BASI|nr:triacylglycerol lipase [Malassezia pachydermatis]KOS16226.1 triacylglycerol lipase [Malassezia pachydermatis]